LERGFRKRVLIGTKENLDKKSSREKGSQQSLEKQKQSEVCYLIRHSNQPRINGKSLDALIQEKN